jgi:hypothetical protein
MRQILAGEAGYISLELANSEFPSDTAFASTTPPASPQNVMRYDALGNALMGLLP